MLYCSNSNPSYDEQIDRPNIQDKRNSKDAESAVWVATVISSNHIFSRPQLHLSEVPNLYRATNYSINKYIQGVSRILFFLKCLLLPQY